METPLVKSMPSGLLARVALHVENSLRSSVQYASKSVPPELRHDSSGSPSKSIGGWEWRLLLKLPLEALRSFVWLPVVAAAVFAFVPMAGSTSLLILRVVG